MRAEPPSVRTDIDEVAFKTGMVGHLESLTDASYAGQVLIITSPLICDKGGGATDECDPLSLPQYFESDKANLKAIVIADYPFLPRTARRGGSSTSGSRHTIPGIHDVDTRVVTKQIRIHGAILVLQRRG